MKSILVLNLALLLMTIVSAAPIVQLNERNYEQKINQAPYTLVYFYSSSCGHCKQFTPVYQKLAKNSELAQYNVSFAKIDGPTYQQLSHSLEVYSYPSLIVYAKGVSLPVFYRRQRKEQPIVDFLLKTFNSSDHPEILPLIQNFTVEKRIEEKASLFYGKRDSIEFKAWDFIVKRDGYIPWAFVESQTTKVVVGDIEITDFSNLTAVQARLAEIFARLQGIQEESWLRMVQKKHFSIVYFNKYGNKKTKQLLSKIAKETPYANFIQINGQHEQYKAALKSVGVHDEENIVAVDKKYDVVYVAPSPYTENGLKEFIQKARDHKLDIYRKTQKTDKINKLTRDNYDERMNTPQDVVLFLYQKSEPIAKELMTLFEYLVYKLKSNKNLLLLRCDVGMNEVQQKLGFVVKPTPQVIFFRNRMKDHPIHFSGKTLSGKSMIEFIMENTTFDFQDEWAEL